MTVTRAVLTVAGSVAALAAMLLGPLWLYGWLS
jgi:hypothetical protein